MTVGMRTAFFAIALFCLAAHAAAASLVPAARITRTDGGVSLRYKGTDDFVSVWRHEKVRPGDTISTGPEGSVELELPDGSLVALGGGAELTFETIEPRRVMDERTGDKRIVITGRLRLAGGRMRAAVGTGSLVLLSAGWADVVTDPATGADVTVAADVFSNGYYLRVTRGCIFAPLRDSRTLPVCGDSRVKVEMFADRLTPMPVPDPFTESISLGLTGEVPEIAVREEPLVRVTVNGREIESEDGTFRITPATPDKTAAVGGTAAVGWAALFSVDDGKSWVTIAPDEDGDWSYRVPYVPTEGYTLRAKTAYVGAPPADIAALAELAVPPSTEEPPAPEEEEVDPDDVASRFVQAFAAALSRGDTGALAGLISMDYNGTAGGTSRSALLRGVSEFFRAGGTLSVSAYATGASLTDGAVIVTMTFSSRVSGTAKSGSLKLWLSSDGKLTHAEGEWVF